jgi:hypothetical protein
MDPPLGTIIDNIVEQLQIESSPLRSNEYLQYIDPSYAPNVIYVPKSNIFTICDSFPCANGGTCEQMMTGEFYCSCTTGWEGTNCTELFNACLNNPCMNGDCVSVEFGFQCICSLGFIGDVCEINVDECADLPCLNDGLCVDGVGSFTCYCDDRYFGDQCEQVNWIAQGITSVLYANYNYVLMIYPEELPVDHMNMTMTIQMVYSNNVETYQVIQFIYPNYTAVSIQYEVIASAVDNTIIWNYSVELSNTLSYQGCFGSSMVRKQGMTLYLQYSVWLHSYSYLFIHVCFMFLLCSIVFSFSTSFHNVYQSSCGLFGFNTK